MRSSCVSRRGREGRGSRPTQAANSRVEGGTKSKKVGVVGAGLMGGEIALVFALAGHSVLLNDRDQDSIDRALLRLRGLMEKGVARGFYTEDQIVPVLGRITPATDLAAFADREMVT